MEKSGCNNLLFIVLLATVCGCQGQGPMYANLRQEMDAFSTRMNKAFDRFTTVFEKFDSRLDTINGSLTIGVGQLNESVASLAYKLKAELNKSHDEVKEMGQNTNRQLSVIENEMHTMQKDSARVKTQMEKGQGVTRDMITSIEGIKDDYEEFKQKTSSLWNVRDIPSNISNILASNKKDITNEIATLKETLISAISEDLLPIQTAIASLLNDMSSVKESVKNIGSSTDCPSRWTRFEHSCYLLVPEKATWKLAKFMCRQMDSFLVEIYSQDEINFLASLAGNKSSTIWTGANIGKKGIWYWSESKSEVKLDLFKGDYPIGRSRRYCGSLRLNSRTFEDRNCGKEYRFICRKFSLDFGE